MRRIDLSNVQEAGERRQLPAGAYVCEIRNVTDYPEKEYLKIVYDIAEGEYRNYFAEARSKNPDWEWYGAYTRSYKTTALPFFKRFCSAINKSNQGFVFDGGNANADERTLIGKRVGLVFQEEEYYSNSGDLRTRLIVARECDVAKVAEQKVPKPKKLQEPATTTPQDTSTAGFMNIPYDSPNATPFV